ncbi:MAG: type II methionyl aminopeptidase, partial [Nanoarchaeota archaeon]|nr:type II methionyl aminopeptidase [Nanoarchaeota archaeon]
MDKETLENFRKAGKISAEALEYGRELIRKGSKVLDVCNKVEDFVRGKGAGLAFPVQISMNEIAAHFCPEDDDTQVFEDQVVCLDIGAEVNGAIGDNACTVDLSGTNSELVKASQEALKAAIEAVMMDETIGRIGKAIEDTITGFGFQPVRNLSGHGLGVYSVHTGMTIPNYDTGEDIKLQKDTVVAIEPFATNGAGMIEEKGDASVFMLRGKKSVRLGFVRDIMKQIEGYKGLPFTTRWL